MGTKIIKKGIIIIILTTIWGCPPADCTFVTKQARIQNLAKISPLQNIYQVGDVITYTATVPSHIINFGNNNEDIDIFQETNVTKSMIGGSEIDKLKANCIEITEGSNELINNILTANLVYNSADNSYQYKAKITLTEIGTYKLIGLNKLLISFKSNDTYCTQYGIETNVLNVGNDGIIEFTVQ